MTEPTIILGLDPGASTGFAKCSFWGEKIAVLDYGIVPMQGADVDSLVSGIHNWIFLNRGDHKIVFSAIPYIPKRRTHHPSLEIQGIIRAAGGIGYNPSTIHSQLDTKNKADTKQFVTRVLGWKPTAIDHVTDAFAVCMAHALKIGCWHPHIEALPAKPHQVCYKRGGRRFELPENPTQVEIRAAFLSGEARVGR